MCAEMNPNGEQTWNWAEMKKYMMKVSACSTLKFYRSSRMRDGGGTWHSGRYVAKEQSETFHEPNTTRLNQFGAVVVSEDHGREGPIQTAWCGFIFDLLETWIPTWRALGVPPKDLGAGDTRKSAVFSTSYLFHFLSHLRIAIYTWPACVLRIVSVLIS